MKQLQISNNADPPLESHRLSEDLDSSCSTPYVSAPSSPGRNPSGYFFSAPASPMHYVLSSSKSSATSFRDDNTTVLSSESSFEFEFEISSRFSREDADKSAENIGSMTSADELFLNGQIRPMKLSSHLQRPQHLAPLIDLDGDDEDGGDVGTVEITRGRDLRSRNRSMHRKARSLSPFRAHEYSREIIKLKEDKYVTEEAEADGVEAPSTETTPSASASSSRSSSSGRNSKKWIFLKDLLYRSKSEGRGNGKDKEKFWSNLSFSQSAREKKLVSISPSLTPSSSRDEKVKKKLASPSLTPSSSRDENDKAKKKLVSPSLTPSSSRDDKDKQKNSKGKKQPAAKKSGGKPANGVSKRRVALSAHELHYTANRAQAEEMKKKTSLPYRQGLFGCLSFSSKSYGAFSVFTRTLNPVSSR
ncbi:hypothetical protein DCAR_0314008 [Daucus carota subsp. sativus]|uniref:Uncharacterized protein n=1 Tax=Daucus carota subsp. sativus TaxID=79200 RepID=A0A161Y349_DAUCS|nr:PREDICTED: hyphally regulated cell wall protein 3 [Daucus carota subsp. sativus]WOG94711.1 hypothetical protein DCAR_0314008 [Daucus carota subsp. sativus]